MKLLLNNSGKIIKSSSNPEIVNFYNRILAAGGTISSNSLQAHSTFLNTLKANNIWDKYAEIGTFAGDYNAAFVKFKYPANIQSTLTNVGFVSSDYSESTGLAGDTSGTKYLKTGFIPKNQLTTSLNAHFSVYSRNSMAVLGSGGSTSIRYLGSLNGGVFALTKNSTSINGSLGAGEMVVSANGVVYPGHLMVSTVGANNGNLYYNGSSVATDTSFSTNSLSPIENFIFAYNFSASQNVSSVCNLICAFYSFGYGLSSSEALIFYNAVQALQTALGRQV
ncbi:MAG: hypothetical protein V7K47_07065 [Nostoc sp.]